jgi:hypothetical protein
MLGERPPLSAVNSQYVTPPHSPQPFLSHSQGELYDTPDSPFNPDDSYTPRSHFSASIGPSSIVPDPDKEGATPAETTAFLSASKVSGNIPSQRAPTASAPSPRRALFWVLSLAALVAVAAAVVVPLYFTVIHKSHRGNNSDNALNNPGSGSGSNSSSGSGNPQNANAITGGNGSKIVSGNTSFTYSNPFGGYCESVVVYLNPLEIFGAYRRLNLCSHS